MDINEIKTKITGLKNDVAPYSNGKIKTGIFANGLTGIFSFGSSGSSSGSSKPFLNDRIYVFIPVLILVAMILLRPSFVYTEHTDKKGRVYRNFCFRKFFLGTFIISVVLMIGYFGYTYKKGE
jgi:hypothetical protein